MEREMARQVPEKARQVQEVAATNKRNRGVTSLLRWELPPLR